MKFFKTALSCAFILSNIYAEVPDESLKRLPEGNKRYVEDRLLHPD